MPIAASDIKRRYSVAAAAGNTTAGTAATSLGDQLSTTDITTSTDNNLFSDVVWADNLALTSFYRCIFVLNNHATLTAHSVTVWLPTQTAGGGNVAISVDTTATSAKGSGSAQAKTVANERTAPASQTFTAPTTKATGLSIGALAPGECHAVWIRLTATSSTTVADDATLRVSFTTLP